MGREQTDAIGLAEASAAQEAVPETAIIQSGYRARGFVG